MSSNHTQFFPGKLPEHAELLIWALVKPSFTVINFTTTPTDEKIAHLAIFT